MVVELAGLGCRIPGLDDAVKGTYFARFGVLLAAKAAEIVPCPDSDEETLIFSPLQNTACILSAKQAMEGAKACQRAINSDVC